MNAPTREEFLQRRRSGIGGSDVSVILGLSPWRTPVQLWAEKTGRAPGQDETLAMRFGTFAEQFVADEYERDTGHQLQRFNAQLNHPTSPLIGNVDRLVIPDGAKIAALRGQIRTDRGWEGKTSSIFNANSIEWGESGTDAVPSYYLLQVQTYQELTGCQYWDLSVLFGNQECRHYTIQRDKELGEEIARRADEWWNKYVVADVAPEPVCEADIKVLFPRSTDKSIEADAVTIDLVAQAKGIAAQIATLEKVLDGDKANDVIGIKERIKIAMADASVLTVAGQPVATYKSNKDSTKIDWEAIARSLGAPAEVIAQHSKTVPGARPFKFK